jgi:hypothetical protein
MFDRIKNWLANRDGAPVAPDGYRNLGFPGGKVALPANWIMTDRGSEGAWVAKSPDRKIEIFFSVTYFAPGTLEEDCERFAMLAVERTQAEMSRGGGAVVTRPDILVQSGETLVAQYEGREGSIRQFACRMTMRCGVVAVVHVEARQEDQAWLNDVSSVVFDSLSLYGS